MGSCREYRKYSWNAENCCRGGDLIISPFFLRERRNVVATIDLGTQLDAKHIVRSAKNSEYNPRVCCGPRSGYNGVNRD
jgi:hypothetical protein